MNYQFPKKIEEAIFELFRKGIRLNKPERAIFIGFEGHVDWINFTVDRNGYKAIDKEPSDEFRIRLQPYNLYSWRTEERKKELNEFWKELSKVLKLADIYFDELVHELLKSEPIIVQDGIIESGSIGKYSKNKQILKQSIG